MRLSVLPPVINFGDTAFFALPQFSSMMRDEREGGE